MLFSAKTVPAAYARPFRGVGAPTRGTRFCLARFHLVTSADRAGSGGGLELGPKLAGKVLPGASRTQHLQPRRGGGLGERRRVESGNAAYNVEIDSFSALDVASGRRRCTRPPRRSRLQASQPRQATTRERRPGKWRARWQAAHPASLHARPGHPRATTPAGHGRRNFQPLRSPSPLEGLSAKRPFPGEQPSAGRDQLIPGPSARQSLRGRVYEFEALLCSLSGSIAK